MSRFIPFIHGKDMLELNRVYQTHKGKEVLFKSRTEIERGIFTYDEIQGDQQLDEWACWWDTGVCANALAEEIGEIAAVEIKEIPRYADGALG